MRNPFSPAARQKRLLSLSSASTVPQLPAPEDLAEDTGPPLRRDDRARAPRERSSTRKYAVMRHKTKTNARARVRKTAGPCAPFGIKAARWCWFRVDIGRERKADPRWLLPLLCRAGDVTKAEIGSIKIFDRDTRFQVAAEFADKFADAARSMKPNEGRISRIGASMGDDAGARDNPAHHTARKWKDAEAKAPTSSDPQTSPRAKTPWRDRKKEEASAHPHRKGNAPRAHSKGPGPHPGSSKSNGANKPVSKYSHKKKHRPAS